jgi:hypothetical protein
MAQLLAAIQSLRSDFKQLQDYNTRLSDRLFALEYPLSLSDVPDHEPSRTSKKPRSAAPSDRDGLTDEADDASDMDVSTQPMGTSTRQSGGRKRPIEATAATTAGGAAAAEEG